MILSTRPHPITILTRSLFSIILLVVYAALLMGQVAMRSGPFLAWILLYAAIAVAALRVVIEIVRWLHRRYTLTDARITSTDGLLRRWHVDMPLESIQYVVLHKSFAERALGLGTVGVSSAGGGLEVLWLSIARPEHARDTISTARDAARAAALHQGRAARAPSDRDSAPSPRRASERRGEGGERGEDQPERPGASRQPSPRGSEPPRGEGGGTRPLVIGLAGGIGSGKSAVARFLESLGAVVSDSDVEAKALLQTPAVKDTLRTWWGDRILAADGSVDRHAVANIVFADPAERRRLESLIHPMLREGRERLKREAAARGTRIIVIDASLLFEAGVDAECDEVWFIDTPREQRLARLQSTRDWTDAELTRREAAQMPLDEKRRRATRVISNDGDEATLHTCVREALQRAQRVSDGSPPATPPPG